MTYQERQDLWVKLNNVTEGTVVSVISETVSFHDGWDNTWAKGMSELVGKDQTFIVRSISKNSRGIGIGDYNFPYYVLFVHPHSTEPLPNATPDYTAQLSSDRKKLLIRDQEIPVEKIDEIIKALDDYAEQTKPF